MSPIRFYPDTNNGTGAMTQFFGQVARLSGTFALLNRYIHYSVKS